MSIVTAGSLPLAPGSVTVVTAPTDGTAVAQSDGSILYTPTTGYTGNDSFTYTIADTLGNVSDTGTIAVSISHAVPPVATNVVAPALSGSPNVITVLSNVSSGSPLVASSVKIASAPSNGTALVNASTGAITYTPDPGFIGTDTFTYTAEDETLMHPTPPP